MKRFFLVSIAFLVANTLFGKDVSVEQAKIVATAFLQQTNVNGLRSAVPIHLTLVHNLFATTPETTVQLKSASTESPEIHAFTINQTDGFVLVAGDDAAIPILGYSLTERLDTLRGLPENLCSWIEGYRQQIRSLRTDRVESSSVIDAYWKGDFGTLGATQSVVLPLLKTKWDQYPYYNELCPYDETYQMRNSVGCMATAMAQIMKYWEFPSKGFGVHAYKHATYGILSADFGATSYEWASMPDSVGQSNHAVATLMYHCGISVNMDYDILAGSGALMSFPDATIEHPNAETGLITHFGYSPSLKGLLRNDYSESDWLDSLKNELDAGRPILYGGYGIGYGHAFVCDGYDANNYFHMNWGWSGYGNGYFLIDALNPFPEYPFNLRQQALLGIRPKDPTKEAHLELTADVVINKPTIQYGEGFTISTSLLNVGSTVFNGDYCAALFDEKQLLVGLADIQTGQTLGYENQLSQNASFTSEGLPSMVPGTYRAYVLHRPTGRFWGALSSSEGDTTYKPYAEVEVGNSNEISLYAAMHLASTPAYANDTLSVWLTVENHSLTDFQGSLLLAVYTKEGVLVDTIEEKTHFFLASQSHSMDSLNFYTTHISMDPGVYLLKLMHRREGSTYELTGSSVAGFNPIKIELLEPLPTADVFEVNDALETAFPLPVTFVSDQANVTTPCSNIHSSTDVDFYVLHLEAGYEYIVNAMVHDKMVSNNGNNYTVDGAFHYSTDGISWSRYFDDEPSGEIIISDETQLYFKVEPTVPGKIGSYLLDVAVDREVKSSVAAPVSYEVIVSPNPFTDCINVVCSEVIQAYQLFDVHGRLLKKASIDTDKGVIDLSAFGKGMFILKLVSGDMVYFNKLVKK